MPTTEIGAEPGRGRASKRGVPVRPPGRRTYGIRFFGKPLATVEVEGRSGPTVLSVSEITRFEIDDDYLLIHASGRTWMAYVRLGQVQKLVAPEDWVRLNRHDLINVSAVRSVHLYPGRRLAFVLVDGTVVVASRRLTPRLKTRFQDTTLWSGAERAGPESRAEGSGS